MARSPTKKPRQRAQAAPSEAISPDTPPTDIHHDVCACGHAKCRHDHRSGYVTGCVAPGPCPCRHFTWSHFGKETAHDGA